MNIFGVDEPAAPPIQGLTPRTVASSASGSVKARESRALKVDRIRRLWRVPRTMNEIQALSGYPLSSVCSLKACLEHELKEVDQVEHRWPDGTTTFRTRWQLKATKGAAQ